MIETLGSSYSHGLLNPTKSSKLKNQVVHEQKFKDPLSSKCQVSSERRVLDLESEVPGSVITVGNILSLDFFLFSCVKPFDGNIGIITNVVFVKNSNYWFNSLMSTWLVRGIFKLILFMLPLTF